MSWRDWKPYEVAAYLRSQEVPEAVVDAFVREGVSGSVIAEGLDDGMLEHEIGIAKKTHRSNVLGVLGRLTQEERRKLVFR